MYITHSDIDSPYGAGSSLRAHLGIFNKTLGRNSSCIQREFNINRYLYRSTKKVHADGLNNIYLAPFRYEFIWKGAPKTKLERLLPPLEGFQDLINLAAVPVIYYALIRERPSIVHLNSASLIGIVVLLLPLKRLIQFKIVVHCRELVKQDTRRIHDLAARNVDQWICIDRATEYCLRHRFNASSRSPIKRIPNPIHFTNNDVPLPESLQWLKQDKSKIYLCAGQLSREKGLDIIVSSFIKAAPENSKLLLIGDFYQRVDLLTLREALSTAPDRIVYHSRIDNLAATKIYSYVHCLVRADPEFCSGRTTFEALLNGCFVIMHADREYIANEEGINKYSKQILCYRGLETERLSMMISECSKLKRLQLSNEDRLQRYQQRNEAYAKECELIYKTLSSSRR